MIEDGELALMLRTYAWNLRIEVEYKPTATTKTCTEAKVKGRAAEMGYINTHGETLEGS
jgi:hypothetical protein